MKHIDFYLDAIQKKTSSGGGGTGGITPIGTKEISITENGERTEDVTQYANAHIVVDVPVPDEPTGTMQITQNGIHDVKNFASADVQVPVPAAPTGSKVIEITENGNTKHDVKDFAEADVRVNVPASGITPSGVKTITSNGTHDVTEFAQAKVEVPVGVNPSGTKTIDIVENGSVTENIREFENVTVNVNVPTGGGSGVPQEKYDSLLKALQTQTQAYSFTNDEIISLRDSAFYNDRQLSSVTLQNVTHVGANAFERCTMLSKCSVDKMKTCGDSAFSRANLSQAVFPNLSGIARNMFVFCSYLKKVKCDKAVSIDERAFNGCVSLEVIDILGGGNISAPSTSELHKLKSVVLRGTENVTPTSDTIWLPSSVTIYVPDNLVEQYKSATNWSSRTIKPLSEYVEV